MLTVFLLNYEPTNGDKLADRQQQIYKLFNRENLLVSRAASVPDPNASYEKVKVLVSFSDGQRGV